MTSAASVARLPARLRVVPMSAAPTSPLDALLSSGLIDPRQHAAGLVYRGVRRRWEEAECSAVAALSDAAHAALKRRHAALIEAAGFDRFALDRLCLDEDVPMLCEVERVRAALGRVVESYVAITNSA